MQYSSICIKLKIRDTMICLGMCISLEKSKDEQGYCYYRRQDSIITASEKGGRNERGRFALWIVCKFYVKYSLSVESVLGRNG